MEKRRYVEFLYPGSFVSETGEKAAPAAVAFPPGAYGWRHFWRWECPSPAGWPMRSEPFDYTDRTYVGEVVTLDDIPDTADWRVLRDNMRINKWSRVLKCAQGHIPLNDGDLVVAEAPQAVA